MTPWCVPRRPRHYLHGVSTADRRLVRQDNGRFRLSADELAFVADQALLLLLSQLSLHLALERAHGTDDWVNRKALVAQLRSLLNTVLGCGGGGGGGGGGAHRSSDGLSFPFLTVAGAGTYVVVA